MKKEEIEKWIKRNQDGIDQNRLLIKSAEVEIEFSEKIIEEIKKIKPEEKSN
jgi:hypothetical protein